MNKNQEPKIRFISKTNQFAVFKWICPYILRKNRTKRNFNVNFLLCNVRVYYMQNFDKGSVARQTNCMTRMISRDYHFRYHSAYYIVYHRFFPKTYTKLFSIKGCCVCCCCFQCNFPYLIVGIRAWLAGRENVSVIGVYNNIP
jgi:hypothetical protein